MFRQLNLFYTFLAVTLLSLIQTKVSFMTNWIELRDLKTFTIEKLFQQEAAHVSPDFWIQLAIMMNRKFNSVDFNRQLVSMHKRPSPVGIRILFQN